MTDRSKELTELELEELELTVELRARQADLAEGLVPGGMTRALFDHELASRTNFASLEAELDTAAETIRNRLVMDRQAFLELLETDLARTPDAAGVVDRITAIDGPAGVLNVAGAKGLVFAATKFHKGVLTDLAMAGATRVRTEATAQGVTVPTAKPKLTPEDRSAIDRQATRLAQGPLVDLVRALREQAFVEAAR